MEQGLSKYTNEYLNTPRRLDLDGEEFEDWCDIADGEALMAGETVLRPGRDGTHPSTATVLLI
jgi:hypothetical protein